MELLPTYEEWIVEMKKMRISVQMQVSMEDMARLYHIVNAILRVHLEMDPHIDYDDCFRAKGCAKEIFMMSPEQRFAAIAYMKVLCNSHDMLTRLMGKNILDELENIYETGVIPKTHRELQREESEKEKNR